MAMAGRECAMLRKFTTAAYEPFLTIEKHYGDRIKLLSLAGMIGVLVVGLNTVVTDQYTKWMETKMGAVENKVDSVLLIVTNLKQDQMGLKANLRDLCTKLGQTNEKLDAAMIILEAMFKKK